MWDWAWLAIFSWPAQAHPLSIIDFQICFYQEVDVVSASHIRIYANSSGQVFTRSGGIELTIKL